MIISNATELFLALKNRGYDNQSRDPWWWPNSGTFRVVIGAILTQNTTWRNVEKAFFNLEQQELLSLEAIANIELEYLAKLIRPSGFYKAKSKNLKLLSQNILQDFQNFLQFQIDVTRDWLLEQRGIGQESADAILNYACLQEAFVVDSYTARLLAALGFEFDSYSSLQEWIVQSFYNNYSQVYPGISRAQAYARAHGMIVEYCKVNKKGRVVDCSELFQK